MKLFWRYLLVVLLVSGMAVDPALARRLFQRKCRPKKCCPCVCVSGACTTCPAPCGEIPCDSPSEAPCLTVESAVTEATCYDCAISSSSVPSEVTSEELIEPTTPELNEPAQDSLAEQPSLPPAPIAVPESSETAAPTEPLVPPIDEPPATDIVGDRYSADSLFDSEAEEEPTVVPPPADANATEDSTDIFGDPGPAEQQPPAEDPLPEPDSDTSAPSEAEPEADDDPDDIFGAAESGGVEEEGEEEYVDEPDQAESDEAEPPTESYDPFGDLSHGQKNYASVLEEAGGLRSESSRTWTDNTALYQCHARLLRVTTKQVILKQDSGRKVVVPFGRLAESDLQFVRDQVTALRVAHASDTAAEKLAVVWPTN